MELILKRNGQIWGTRERVQRQDKPPQSMSVRRRPAKAENVDCGVEVTAGGLGELSGASKLTISK